MMGGFGMGFMGIFWVAIIAVVVILAWQYLKPDKTLGSPERSSLDILKLRYARGEIDKKEYEDKKRDLIE